MGGVCCTATDDDWANGATLEDRLSKEYDGPVLNDTYKLGAVLGTGGSCSVRNALGMNDLDGKDFAVKIMSKTEDRRLHKRLYEAEVSILGKLDHPNIVKMTDHFESNESFYIIQELAHGGELFDRIIDTKTYGTWTEKRAATLVRTMLECVQYLQTLNIIHRDLKPENFVFETPSQDSKIILVDFGCAKVVKRKEAYQEIMGTPYYLAPESASRRTRRTGEILMASDVWAVGIIAYVMLTGQPPFGGRSRRKILDSILKHAVVFPKHLSFSSNFVDFIRKVLRKKPEKRLTADEALHHPWLTGGSSSEMVHADVLKCLKQYNYQTKLKKLVSKLLVDNMGVGPRRKAQKMFDELDKNGDGELENFELEQLLTKLGTEPAEAREETDKMMAEVDQNHDGRISFDEFATIWQRKLLSVNNRYCDCVFKTLDVDNDEMISLKEIEEVFEGSTSEMQSLLQEVDQDRDGQISLSEFRAAMREEIESGRVKLGRNKVNERVEPEDQIDDDIRVHSFMKNGHF